MFSLSSHMAPRRENTQKNQELLDRASNIGHNLNEALNRVNAIAEIDPIQQELIYNQLKTDLNDIYNKLNKAINHYNNASDNKNLKYLKKCTQKAEKVYEKQYLSRYEQINKLYLLKINAAGQTNTHVVLETSMANTQPQLNTVKKTVGFTAVFKKIYQAEHSLYDSPLPKNYDEQDLSEDTSEDISGEQESNSSSQGLTTTSLNQGSTTKIVSKRPRSSSFYCMQKIG